MSYKKISLIFITSMLLSTPVHAIKKCKDADGKWHYGDIAVRECENSKVTTLSEQGFIKAEKAAPKTVDELAAEEAQLVELEAEKQRQEEIDKEKTRILSIYETEEAIDRQRENQLYSVDSNIAVHNTYLESMKEQIAYHQKQLAKTTHAAKKTRIEKKITDTEARYEKYSKELALLKSQREVVIKRFDKEKRLYQELTKAKEDKRNGSAQ